MNIKRIPIEVYRSEFEEIKKRLDLQYDWDEINLNIIDGQTYNYYIPPTDEILINYSGGKCQIHRFAHELVHKYIHDMIQSPILSELNKIRSSLRKKVRETIETLDRKSREHINNYLTVKRERRKEFENRIGYEKIREIEKFISSSDDRLSEEDFIREFIKKFGSELFESYINYVNDDTSFIEEYLNIHRDDYLILTGLLKEKPLLVELAYGDIKLISVPRCLLKDGNTIMMGPSSVVGVALPNILFFYGQSDDYFSDEEKELLMGPPNPKTEIIRAYLENWKILRHPTVFTSIDEPIAHIISFYFEGKDLRDEKVLNDLKLQIYHSAHWGRDDENLYKPMLIALEYIKQELERGESLEETLIDLIKGKYFLILYEKGFIKNLPHFYKFK